MTLSTQPGPATSPAAQALFETVYEVPPAERGARVDRACGTNDRLRAEVYSLLQAYDAAGHFLTLSPGQATTPDAPGAPATAPETGTDLGDKYHLVRKLGEGGMGEVWEAEQAHPVRRPVAVKLVRAGLHPQDLVRFEFERQALALMDHPGIAQVLDAGYSAAGRPFLVMELIDGVALTTHCEAHRVPLRERLDLFRQVCEAVQHAHQKGVIHRDLKPSNILVESGDGRPRPKVIDFGLVKSLRPGPGDRPAATLVGFVIGTPGYMAPEQAGFGVADVDTRADVYSLGAILFELLTGTTPHPRATTGTDLEEVFRTIREDDAPAPSRRVASATTGRPPAISRAAVKGDLDWIVLKALARDRERRYASPLELAADVGRHLGNEPVSAGPPGTAYRLRKFVRRNRPAVLAGGLVVGTLLAGVTGTTLGLISARRHADTAEQALRVEAEAHHDLMAGLDAMTSDAAGDSLAAQHGLSRHQEQFLTTVLAIYQKSATAGAGDETVRFRTAVAAYQVGQIQWRLGKRDEAVAAFRQALERFDGLCADYPLAGEYESRLAISRGRLGHALRATGKAAEARQEFLEAVSGHQRLAARVPENPDYRLNLAASRRALGDLSRAVGKTEDAAAEYQAVGDLLRPLVRQAPDNDVYRAALAAHHTAVGQLYQMQGGLPAAAAEFRSACAIEEALVEAVPLEPRYRQSLAVSRHNLGDCYRLMNETKPALAEYRRGRALLEQLDREFPNEPIRRHHLATNHSLTAACLAAMNEPEQARAEFAAAERLMTDLVRQFPRAVVYQENLSRQHTVQGNQYHAQGDFAKARAAYRAALDIQSRLLDASPDPQARFLAAQSHCNLASVLIDLGEYGNAQREAAEGERHIDRVIRDAPEIPDYLHTKAVLMGNLARATHRGDPREAERLMQACILSLKRVVAAAPAAATYQLSLAQAYCTLGSFELRRSASAPALAAYARALETLEPLRRKDASEARVRFFLISAYLGCGQASSQLGRYLEAIEYGTRTLEVVSAERKPVIRYYRAKAMMGAAQYEQAVAELDDLLRPDAGTKWTPDQLSDFAGMYSAASTIIQSRKGELQDKAVALLEEAIARGLTLSAVRGNANLRYLSQHPGYQILLNSK